MNRINNIYKIFSRVHPTSNRPLTSQRLVIQKRYTQSSKSDFNNFFESMSSICNLWASTFLVLCVAAPHIMWIVDYQRESRESSNSRESSSGSSEQSEQ